MKEEKRERYKERTILKNKREREREREREKRQKQKELSDHGGLVCLRGTVL